MKPFSERMLGLINNRDFQLAIDLHDWETTKNPYYVWSAISRLSGEKLPDWVIDYLKAVSDRMMLGGVMTRELSFRRSSDFRVRKKVRVVKLNPDRDPVDKLLRFEIWISYPQWPRAPRCTCPRSYPNLDIKNLTREQADEIYMRDYWPKAWGDDWPMGFDQITYEEANLSPAELAKRLEQEAGKAKTTSNTAGAGAGAGTAAGGGGATAMPQENILQQEEMCAQPARIGRSN